MWSKKYDGGIIIREINVLFSELFDEHQNRSIIRSHLLDITVTFHSRTIFVEIHNASRADL